jgi:hypothetical protein
MEEEKCEKTQIMRQKLAYVQYFLYLCSRKAAIWISK